MASAQGELESQFRSTQSSLSQSIMNMKIQYFPNPSSDFISLHFLILFLFFSFFLFLCTLKLTFIFQIYIACLFFPRKKKHHCHTRNVRVGRKVCVMAYVFSIASLSHKFLLYVTQSGCLESCFKECLTFFRHRFKCYRNSKKKKNIFPYIFHFFFSYPRC
jgi:hypothetical protein